MQGPQIIKRRDGFAMEVPLMPHEFKHDAKGWLSKSMGNNIFSEDNLIYANKHNTLCEVAGLKTELLQHQKYDITAMIELENKRGITGNKEPQRDGAPEYIKYTNVGILDEPFGSGKTFIVMGLLLKSPMPKHYESLGYACNGIIIKRRYKNILRPALVFCGASVAVQWEETVKKYSNLKTLLIVNVFGLRKLAKMLESNDPTEINQYDMVIIKNGTITGDVEFNGMKISEIYYNRRDSSMPIYSVVANITVNNEYTWSRLIIDDFDTIKPPRKLYNVPNLFTWIVTGTRALKKNTFDAVSAYIDVLKDKLKYQDGDQLLIDYYNNITYDQMSYNLHTMSRHGEIFSFVISCEESFTKQCITIGAPTYYLYKFRNKDNTTIALIGALGRIDLVEMLNGDALESAANELGIKCDSVVDIFEKLIGDNFNERKCALDMEKHLIEYAAYIHMPKSKETYTEKNLIERKPITLYYHNLDELYHKKTEEIREIKEKTNNAIERIKSNIQEGFCAICYELLDANSTIIVKCCGTIQCSTCGVQIAIKNKRCANCRAGLTEKSIVYINKEFDLNKIIAEDINYTIGEETAEPDPADIEPVYLTKLDVLIEIINGVVTHPRTKQKIIIPRVLTGNAKLPEADPAQRSFIVFASYEETLDIIIKKLDKHNITYARLGGTSNQIKKILKDYEDRKFKVLLLNTFKHCSGLNLQMATDMIFMHVIQDQDLEAQAIGRIQRHGRTNAATVHYLAYENELINRIYT